MRVGVYAFSGSGNMGYNFSAILRGIAAARREKLRFLAFHECALTGYPPLEIEADRIDYEKVAESISQSELRRAGRGGYTTACAWPHRMERSCRRMKSMHCGDGMRRTSAPGQVTVSMRLMDTGSACAYALKRASQNIFVRFTGQRRICVSSAFVICSPNHRLHVIS